MHTHLRIRSSEMHKERNGLGVNGEQMVSTLQVERLSCGHPSGIHAVSHEPMARALQKRNTAFRHDLFFPCPLAWDDHR